MGVAIKAWGSVASQRRQSATHQLAVAMLRAVGMAFWLPEAEVELAEVSR